MKTTAGWTQGTSAKGEEGEEARSVRDEAGTRETNTGRFTALGDDEGEKNPTPSTGSASDKCVCKYTYV